MENSPTIGKLLDSFYLKKKGSQTVYLHHIDRPLCLLDTFGKLLEHLLLRRLVEEIDKAGGLAENQYGFRPGRSTIDALAEVMKVVDSAVGGTCHTRHIPVVMTWTYEMHSTVQLGANSTKT